MPTLCPRNHPDDIDPDICTCAVMGYDKARCDGRGVPPAAIAALDRTNDDTMVRFFGSEAVL